MLERSDHVRRLDRLRKRREEQRKRDGKNQLWCHSYWMTDVEAAEVITDVRRIESPDRDLVKDLKKFDNLTISYRECRVVVGRLARAHHKHL